MCGYGMTKYLRMHREPRWRYEPAINVSAGILSTIVVGIFAVAKFTEGAWLIVVVFAILVLFLMHLNRQYREKASVLERSRTDPPDRGHRPVIRCSSSWTRSTWLRSKRCATEKGCPPKR